MGSKTTPGFLHAIRIPKQLRLHVIHFHEIFKGSPHEQEVFLHHTNLLFFILPIFIFFIISLFNYFPIFIIIIITYFTIFIFFIFIIFIFIMFDIFHYSVNTSPSLYLYLLYFFYYIIFVLYNICIFHYSVNISPIDYKSFETALDTVFEQLNRFHCSHLSVGCSLCRLSWNEPCMLLRHYLCTLCLSFCHHPLSL